MRRGSARSPRLPGARRLPNQKLPAWFSSGRPWRRTESGSPRSRFVGRHARPAILALLLASGVGFVRPTDVALVTRQQPVAAPSVSAPAGVVAPAPAALSAPATTAPAATTATTAVASAQPAGAAPATTAALPAELPSSRARRRAQTWEPAADPADLTGYVWPLRGTITDDFGPSPWGEPAASLRVVSVHVG